MRSWLKRKIVKFLIKDMLDLVDIEDVLTLKPMQDKKSGKIYQEAYFGGHKIDTETQVNIKQDAIHFSKSTFWQMVRKVLRLRAQQIGLGKGKLEQGQSILLTLKLIEEVMDETRKKL